MKEILEVLVRWFDFLWVDGRYRITGSVVSTSSGGDGDLEVASDALRLRFVRERGHVFLDFQVPWSPDKGEWYPVDLVRRLITGERQRSSELDEGYASFVRDSLPEIEARFATEEAFQETFAELKKLRRARRA
jgi:hypothetical protein